MLQLGLVFNVTSGGLRTVHQCNAQGQTWTKSIPDLRGDFSVLPNLDGSGKTVYQLRFLGTEGFLIALVKPQKGNMSRGADHSAAWIHVPARAKISGEELVNVLNDVEQAISRLEGTDTAKLNSVFAKQYSENPLRQPLVSRLSSKADGPIAVRNYSATPGAIATLTEVLDAIAQPVYAQCKSVFLVDVAAGLQVASTVKTISEPLKHLVVVEPPKAKDNFVPYLPSAENKAIEFKEPHEFVEGETLKVYWRRKGYATIEKQARVAQGLNSDEAFKFGANDVKRLLLPSFFTVRSEKGTPISNAQIRIDNVILTDKGLPFTETEWTKKRRIMVLAEGYETKNIDDALPTQPGLTISMKAKVFGDRRTLPLNDGSVKIAEVTIEVRGKRQISINDLILKNGELQLKSSKSKGRANQCNTGKGLRRWKYVAIIVSGLIIVLGGLFVLYKLWQEHNEDAKPTLERIEVGSNPDSETGPYSSPEYSLEMVKAYLDNHEKWSRDSLEKYSFSKGLFDALNKYQLEDLRSKYQPIVDKSKKLQDIVIFANKMKGPFPQSQYCNDTVITVDNYIKKLERILADKSAAKNETPQQEPSAPKVKDQAKKVEKTHSDTKPQQTGTPTSQQEAKGNKGGGDATTSSNQNSASPNKSQKKYDVGGPGKSHQKKKIAFIHCRGRMLCYN